MSGPMSERKAYSVGYVALEYNAEWNCWRCGESIPPFEPVFHISRFKSNGDLISHNYHLRCAPKRELRRVLNKIKRSLEGGG